jgi:hypothetical protein
VRIKSRLLLPAISACRCREFEFTLAIGFTKSVVIRKARNAHLFPIRVWRALAARRRHDAIKTISIATALDHLKIGLERICDTADDVDGFQNFIQKGKRLC